MRRARCAKAGAAGPVVVVVADVAAVDLVAAAVAAAEAGAKVDTEDAAVVVVVDAAAIANFRTATVRESVHLMFRRFVLFISILVLAHAQDVSRMDQIVQSYVSAKTFMGTRSEEH